MRAAILDQVGADHLTFMPSGSAAVEWSLRAAGVGSQGGEGVILAAYDYPGNLRAVELVGGRPILVDIEAAGPQIDVSQIEAIPAEDAKAVVVSHLYGVAADVHRLRAICDDRGWILIEDVCQTPGMRIADQSAGSLGHLATFSFGGSKPLTAGSGGAIVTSSARFDAKLRGMTDRPSESTTIPPLAAAALLPQVRTLNDWVRRRRVGAARISRSLPEHCQAILGADDGMPSYYKLAVRFADSESRDAWTAQMNAAGCPVGKPFRSMHAISRRRAEQPFPIVHAPRFANEVALIDHRMLMAVGD